MSNEIMRYQRARKGILNIKKVYTASLCKNGILGGGLYVDNKKITYRTGKLTVPSKLRNLELHINNFKSVEKGRMIGLPAVIVKMKNGEVWKFIVFARGHFLSNLKELGIE